MGWAPLVDRPADYLPSGTVGQWPPVPCNGGPCTRAATRKPTKRGRLGPRAGIPKRTRPKLPPNGVLWNQRGLHQCEKGRGPKDPTVRREATREPRRRGAICCCGLSRQPQARSGQTVGEDRPTSLPSSSTVVVQFIDNVLNFPAVLGTLHLLGSCYMIPGIDYPSFSCAGERFPNRRTFHGVCKWCARDQSAQDPGDHSSDTVTSSSTEDAE